MLSSNREQLRKQAVIVAESDLFDVEWYKAAYPDVAASGADPIMHYLAYGAREGRDPGPWFDTRWYLLRYPDVAQSNVNPLLHYITHGEQEGRLRCSADHMPEPFSVPLDFGLYAMALLAFWTAVNEEVCGVSRIAEQEETAVRVWKRALSQFEEFWSGSWEYNSAGRLCGGAEEDVARYVRSRWKAYVEVATGNADEDRLILLAADALAHWSSLSDASTRALSPRKLRARVRHIQTQAQSLIRAFLNGELTEVEIGVGLNVSAASAFLCISALRLVLRDLTEDGVRQVLKRFLDTGRAARDADELCGDAENDACAVIAHADALVDAGKYAEALCVLNGEAGVQAEVRRLLVDHAIRADWTDYDAVLEKIVDIRLVPLVERLRISAVTAANGSADPLSRMSPLRHEVLIRQLPASYDAMLERMNDYSLAPSGYEALAAWKMLEVVLRAGISRQADESTGHVSVLFILEAHAVEAPAGWLRHCERLRGSGVEVALMHASASTTIAEHAGLREISCLEQLKGFLALHQGPVLVAFGYQYVPFDLAWSWNKILGPDDVARVDVFRVPAHLETLASLQFAYLSDTPAAILFGSSGNIRSGALFDDPALYIGESLKQASGASIATSAVSPVTGGSHFPNTVIVCEESALASLAGAAEQVDIATLGGSDALEGAGDNHAFADRSLRQTLTEVLVRKPEADCFLFLSRDMSYPPHYVRDALRTFRDHDGKADFSFLALQYASSANVYEPVFADGVDIVDMACLGTCCLRRETVEKLLNQERMLGLSAVVATTAPAFFFVPLFGRTFFENHAAQIGGFLDGERKKIGIDTGAEFSSLSERTLSLSEPSRRLATSFIKRAMRLQLMLDRDTANVTSICSAAELSRSMDDVLYLVQRGRISEAKRLVSIIVEVAPDFLPDIKRYNALLCLAIDLGLQSDFAVAHRGLIAEVLKKHQRHIHLFFDVLASGLSKAELEAALDDAAVAAVALDYDQLLFTIIGVYKKYASPDMKLTLLRRLAVGLTEARKGNPRLRNELSSLVEEIDIKKLSKRSSEFSMQMGFVPSLSLDSRLRQALRDLDRRQLILSLRSWMAAGRPLIDLCKLLRTYSHELSSMSIGEKVSEYRICDDAFSRLVFATIVGDEVYLRSVVDAHTQPDTSDVAVVARARTGQFDWLETLIAELGRPLLLATPRFSGGTLQTFFSSVMSATSGRAADGRLPKVSVVMSVYNPDIELMEMAIASVLIQEGVEVELILLDDASEPGVASRIEEVARRNSGIVYERMPRNAGPYIARNRALELATGEFIAIQDGDDVSHPVRLATQVKALNDAGPEAVLATSYHLRVDAGGYPQLEADFNLFGDGTMTSLFRRNVFEKIGGFVKVRSRGDVEMRERVRSVFGDRAIVQVDYPLVYCNASPATLSNRVAASSLHYLKLFRSNFARQHRYLWRAANVGETIAAPDSAVPCQLRP
ncbi:MAG: glycosyltransferase [Parvibaculum sp.]|nr:glycosyltransferase [Parvibaculum sp.]